MKIILFLSLLILTSCAELTEVKTVYFSNQLTPTINASLVFLREYLNCKQIQSNLLKDVEFVVHAKGKEDHFEFIKFTESNTPQMNNYECVKTKKSPYKNKLTRWVNKEKQEITTEEAHSDLYHFKNMYSGTTYNFKYTFQSDNKIKIHVERVDITSGGHFYEEYNFQALLNSNNKLKFQDEYLDKTSQFSW